MAGAGGGAFEVDVSELHAVAGLLRTDSGDAFGVGVHAGDGTDAALGACGGGPLAAALAGYAAAARTGTKHLSEAVGAAGTTLATNADRYTGDDVDAATGLGGRSGADVPWATAWTLPDPAASGTGSPSGYGPHTGAGPR